MTDQPQLKLIDDGPVREAAGLVHRLQHPGGTGPHPAVVMLHGFQGNEDVMWIFSKTVPSHWIKVAPRAIRVLTDGSYSWHDSLDGWPTLPMFDKAVTALTRFVHALPRLYQADPGQVYLLGFSQGAALAFALAMQRPGLVRGIAALVGFLPEESDEAIARGSLLNLPVFIAAGKRDETVPLDRAQDAAAAARAAGAFLEYREYATGHKVNADGLRKLRRWWAERDKER